MAASEYIKQAASQLRRAAQAKKTDIDTMRRDIMNMESAAGSQVNDLRRQEQIRQSQAMTVDTSDERNRKAAELARLKNEEHDTMNMVKDRKNEMNQLIAQMENDMNSLNQFASDLERMAPGM